MGWAEPTYSQVSISNRCGHPEGTGEDTGPQRTWSSRGHGTHRARCWQKLQEGPRWAQSAQWPGHAGLATDGLARHRWVEVH